MIVFDGHLPPATKGGSRALPAGAVYPVKPGRLLPTLRRYGCARGDAIGYGRLPPAHCAPTTAMRSPLASVPPIRSVEVPHMSKRRKISSLKERSLSRGRRRLRCRFLLRDELRSRMTGRARLGLGWTENPEDSQGRPQAARRGSLDGPVSCRSHNRMRSPVGASCSPPAWCRCEGTLWDPSPEPVGAGGQTRKPGCRSSLRRARRHGVVRPQPLGLNQWHDLAAVRGP